MASGNELLPNHYIRPGHIIMPTRAMRLAAVVGSGVVVTIYDRRRRQGGVSYYTHPIRKKRLSGPMFAAPSIVHLVEMFRKTGSSPHELEANLYGGAINPRSIRFEPGLSEANIATAIQLLEKLHINNIGQDVGGLRGRKIVFHTGTGEALIAKVEHVRDTDWYPPYDPDELARLEQRAHV